MNKIIYLDAAASYQKSDAVINAQVGFLRNRYANSGRGICARATDVDNMIAQTRQQVAKFINADDERQIVFTAGTTDAMNQIAQMLNLKVTDIVVVSDLDHHSARLPFEQTKAKILVCDLTDSMDIDAGRVPYADVVVITAMSNVLGVAQDVEQIIKCAKKQNPHVITVVDAAQFVVHETIDVKKWNCDFVCWSGHKIGGDTGLGVMYIKNPDMFAPVRFGGGMVNKILDGNLLLNNAPDCFEAGTLPLTQIAGLASAIDELTKNRPDLNLIKYAYDELSKIPQIKMISKRDAALISFVVQDMHVIDFGAMLGARGVCVRVGNMCASWIMKYLGIDGVVRISVGGYNTLDEVKQVIEYIKDIVK